MKIGKFDFMKNAKAAILGKKRGFVKFVTDAKYGEILGVQLPDDEWDTVGGLLLGLAGRVPEEGEVFHLEGLSVVPELVQGRRVSRVRISLQ